MLGFLRSYVWGPVENERSISFSRNHLLMGYNQSCHNHVMLSTLANHILPLLLFVFLSTSSFLLM